MSKKGFGLMTEVLGMPAPYYSFDHMHTADHCVYRDVAYICGGAASGAWWNGSQYGFPPCYGRLELFEDGTFDYQLVDYGWKASDWRGKQLSL